MKQVDITALRPHQLDEASAVIVDAFREEAITSSFLDLSRERCRQSYFHVLRFKLGLYLAAGQPLFTALSGSRIVGAAILNSPRVFISRGRLFREALPALPRMLGLLPYSMRAARLGRLVKPPGNLPANHYTLELLAVHRSYRGRGVGRLLLDHVTALCAADETASGVYLLTGEEKNRALYEKSGYGLWETRQAGSLIAYHMFKAKPS